MFVIIVLVGNNVNVFGPYSSFIEAAGVVNSSLFSHTVITEVNKTVDGVLITKVTAICP